mmetsp:Transcript_17033/g.53327  ORF Transcript_17033/g.53327 Transcript_17033/m.53327 type:complete len:242 (-) Transcript_17033:907-1632(-)
MAPRARCGACSAPWSATLRSCRRSSAALRGSCHWASTRHRCRRRRHTCMPTRAPLEPWPPSSPRAAETEGSSRPASSGRGLLARRRAFSTRARSCWTSGSRILGSTCGWSWSCWWLSARPTTFRSCPRRAGFCGCRTPRTPRGGCGRPWRRRCWRRCARRAWPWPQSGPWSCRRPKPGPCWQANGLRARRSSWPAPSPCGAHAWVLQRTPRRRHAAACRRPRTWCAAWRSRRSAAKASWPR